MVIKKLYKIGMCLLFILCVGCQRKEVKLRMIYSDIYSEEEIQEAIDVVKKEFSKEWKGCTLKEIYYAGDNEARFKDITKQYGGEEAIVLKTNFHTNYFAWKIGLNSNCDYEDYQWILIRNNNGKWKHVDGGYG